MILYTTMPQELIFPVENSEYDKTRIIDYNGVSLVVQQTEMNTYQIVRNLSTDPSHYLNSNYAPGQTINFK
ncbi:hypothetical protein FIU87_09730 [Bacillus sp. THAF10]|uniref:YlzJ-like family protein n=1 Tax=Bacillus sp. THAF10 TaxID=2587848 RepID=UPI001267E62F|nr:YlzJ-like family protein [Bacillus sp. THAF10]QFT88926.1 hypothetical protein FIU87_09730 [Bacillus sp. THAF10]